MSDLTPEARAEYRGNAEAYSEHGSIVISSLARQLARALDALDEKERELADAWGEGCEHGLAESPESEYPLTTEQVSAVYGHNPYRKERK